MEVEICWSEEYTIIVGIIWSGDRRRAALVWAAQPFLSSIQQAIRLDQDILTYLQTSE